MGQAKRNRSKRLMSPCRCGSQMPAESCCYDGKTWRKLPASLSLKSLAPGSALVEKCYMRELNTCSGGLSGEHLISKSIIKFLMQDGEFSISGLPWLEEGESKILGPNSLVAKCLCERHNSALSPLDTAALKFFEFLRVCWENEEGALHFLVSGHDLERWLLKSLKATAVSGNLGRGRVRLPGDFQQDVRLVEMLDDPLSWPARTGLYCLMRPGETTENHNRFQLAPLYGLTNDVIAGLWANILGLSFIVMAEPPDLVSSPQLRSATFRPGRFEIKIGTTTNVIDLSWDDKIPHQTISLKFVTKVQL